MNSLDENIIEIIFKIVIYFVQDKNFINKWPLKKTGMIGIPVYFYHFFICSIYLFSNLLHIKELFYN